MDRTIFALKLFQIFVKNVDLNAFLFLSEQVGYPTVFGLRMCNSVTNMCETRLVQ